MRKYPIQEHSKKRYQQGENNSNKLPYDYFN